MSIFSSFFKIKMTFTFDRILGLQFVLRKWYLKFCNAALSTLIRCSNLQCQNQIKINYKISIELILSQVLSQQSCHHSKFLPQVVSCLVAVVLWNFSLIRDLHVKRWFCFIDFHFFTGAKESPLKPRRTLSRPPIKSCRN